MSNAARTRSPICPPSSGAAAARWICQSTRSASSARSSMPRRYPSTRSLPARRQWARAGADVIDLGCLPDTPFPHLEDSVRALKAAGHDVSVDSANADELERGGGGRRGLSAEPHRSDACTSRADYPVTPILIPQPHSDLDSLRAPGGDGARPRIFPSFSIPCSIRSNSASQLRWNATSRRGGSCPTRR